MINPLTAPEQLALVFAGVAALAVTLSWRSSRRVNPRRRGAIVTCRLLGIAGLAVIAFNLGGWKSDPARTARRPALLIDRSFSMTVADVDGSTRWGAARRLARKALETDEIDVHAFAGPVPVRVGSLEELDALEPDGTSTRFAVSVIEEKLNILFAEGLPYWDSKFLSQLLRRNENVDLTTIYRISSDKYFILSSSGEDERVAETAFPKSLEALRKYDMIILGKGLEYMLDAADAANLENYVADHGGAVLFARGKPSDDQFEALTALEPVVWGDPVRGQFEWRPTRTGERAGLFNDMLPGPNDSIWSGLPAIKRARRCPKVKTFGQVLIEGVSRKGDVTFPVVVGRKLGRGMTMAVNSEGLWNWDFFPAAEKASQFYREFWLQMILWLARCSDFLPGRHFSLRLSDASPEVGQPVIATISGRGPLDESNRVRMRILDDDTVIQSFEDIEFKPPNGIGDVVFTLDQPGRRVVELTGEHDGETQRVAVSVRVPRPPAETDDVSADPDYLETLTSACGGNLLSGDEALKTLSSAPKVATGPGLEARWVPAWPRWWVLCLVLLPFAAECLIRRRSGLS